MSPRFYRLSGFESFANGMIVSCSVILISPQNEVLLLHRVKTSSSFPSAHVFPGGNISSQDGDFPPAGHPDSHDEGIHYRKAAIRELFEESGILLAKHNRTGRMVNVSAEERERGRHAIHMNEITFDQWLKSQDPDAVPDTGQLHPIPQALPQTTYGESAYSIDHYRFA